MYYIIVLMSGAYITVLACPLSLHVENASANKNDQFLIWIARVTRDRDATTPQLSSGVHCAPQKMHQNT
jgi:hypothetical protein